MVDDANRVLEDAKKHSFLDEIARVLERDGVSAICVIISPGTVPGYAADISTFHYDISSGMELRGILATVLTDSRLSELNLTNNRRGG